MQKPEILYMVVPCYNEEAVLHETAKQLKEKYQSLISRELISKQSRVVFVNDGSQQWSSECRACRTNDSQGHLRYGYHYGR